MASPAPAVGVARQSDAPAAQRSSGYAFVRGALAGTVQACALQPFDRLRTVQQGIQLRTSPGVPAPRLSTLALVKEVYQAGGLANFYRGLLPTAVRVFFGAGVYFALLEAFSGGMGRNRQASSLEHFAAGASARATASVLLSPITVVKTRMEFAMSSAGATLPSMSAALRQVWAQGRRGLFAGLGPSILRDAPYSGVYFMLYQRLLPLADAAWGGHAASAATFSAAFAAGGAATLLTQPFDMLRTRAQLADVAKGEVGMVSILRSVVASEGALALYRGAALRVAKRSLSSGITWSLVEYGRALGTASNR
ncbi:Slc25a38 [Symbiodinium sp. KB8]|nr:Slc25a38 [Symbiodinium sp. KB8]